MAHAHHHDHNGSEYYLEQLLTILICGTLGIVAVLMYQLDRLSYLLVPAFHPWVLGGGIALLILTAIRGIAVLRAVRSAPTTEHVHGPECDHDHMPGMHYIKIIPLTLPVLLFVLGLPNTGFSKDWIERRLGHDDVLSTNIGEVAEKSGDLLAIDFAELSASAYDPGKRTHYEGRRVRVTGQLKAIGEKEYTIFYWKLICCVSDTILLKARIKTDTDIPRNFVKDFDWVTVEGVLQYVEVPAKKTFVPVIHATADKIKPTTPVK